MKFFGRRKEDSPAYQIVSQAERILSSTNYHKEINFALPGDVAKILLEVVDMFDQKFPPEMPEDFVEVIRKKLSNPPSMDTLSEDIFVSLSREEVLFFWRCELALIILGDTEIINRFRDDGPYGLARRYLSLSFLDAGGEH